MFICNKCNYSFKLKSTFNSDTKYLNLPESRDLKEKRCFVEMKIITSFRYVTICLEFIFSFLYVSLILIKFIDIRHNLKRLSSSEWVSIYFFDIIKHEEELQIKKTANSIREISNVVVNNKTNYQRFSRERNNESIFYHLIFFRYWTRLSRFYSRSCS